MAVVYIVEDDESLRDGLVALLDLAGHKACVCTEFSQVDSDILAASPDCVVLDLKLPETDGLSIARSVREASGVAIIMLTSSDAEFDEVMAMRIGVDDFIQKPYRPAALLARIDAVIARKTPAAKSARVVEHRGVSLDLDKSSLTCGSETVELPRNEFRILSMLMGNAGAIVSRQDLMCELWQTDAFVDDNTLTVNVNRLRKYLQKVGAPDDFLVTHRGQGYRV